MSPPIRDGSGSSIGSIRLGDGSEISEVRTGAGDVLFSAIPIPDSVVSRPDDNDSSTSSGRTGMRIKTKASWPSIQARISANTTTFTDAFITRVSDGTDLLQVDVSQKSSNDVITFSNVDLQSNTEFNITLVNNSGDIVNGFNTSADAFPYTSDAVDIISRSGGRTGLSQTFVEFGNINL